MAVDALTLARVLVLMFFTVLFLQSGVDKVVDWKGNLTWLKEHFGQTFLRGVVPMLLGLLTCMECLTAVACAFAIVVMLTGGAYQVPMAAMTLACTTLIMLFTGQRLAKDYPGAVSIASYFAVALIGLVLMGVSAPPAQ